jgi:hypothetical protein
MKESYIRSVINVEMMKILWHKDHYSQIEKINGFVKKMENRLE